MGEVPPPPPMGEVPPRPPMGEMPPRPPMGEMPPRPPMGEAPAPSLMPPRLTVRGQIGEFVRYTLGGFKGIGV